MAVEEPSLTKGAAAHRSHAIWLLGVDGGEATLRQHLLAFSKLGAVRADFRDEYAVSGPPLCGGGSIAVFEARLQRHGGMVRPRKPKRFVVKVVMLDCSEDSSKVDYEVKLLLMAQGHPNITRLSGVFCCQAGKEHDEGPQSSAGAEGSTNQQYLSLPMSQPCQVLLTELCCKGNLHAYVTARGPYLEWKGLDLIAGLLSALAHIHGIGLVHRDVKSESVLLSSDGQPVLADFGIAARLSDIEAMNMDSGTEGYAAPETFLPMPYGEKVDIFGAGVVLYFALVAHLPFAEGQTREAVVQSTLQCHVQFTLRSTLSEEAQQFVRTLLVRDPKHRPMARTALETLKLLRPQQHRRAERPAQPERARAIAPSACSALEDDAWESPPDRAGSDGEGEALAAPTLAEPKSLGSRSVWGLLGRLRRRSTGSRREDQEEEDGEGKARGRELNVRRATLDAAELSLDKLCTPVACHAAPPRRHSVANTGRSFLHHKRKLQYLVP